MSELAEQIRSYSEHDPIPRLSVGHEWADKVERLERDKAALLAACKAAREYMAVSPVVEPFAREHSYVNVQIDAAIQQAEQP